jgi:uncharacterized phage-like protein YoqJ
MIVVPLTSDPCQVVTITLDGTEYDLIVKWNEARQSWSMDVLRRADQVYLAMGVSLFLGVDLLSGFGVQIGNFFMIDESEQGIDATSDDGDLGGRVKLYYFAPGET